MLRCFLCWMMLVVVPVSLMGQPGVGQNAPGQASPAQVPAQSAPGQSAPAPPVPGQTESGQAGAAILHAQGGVWVNGYEARDASAIFPGDLLETKPGATANLSLDGTSVLIQPESVAKLQTDLLELDHGNVLVGTSKGFKVRVNCITVVPVLNEWTQYEVANVNGNVQVAARKNDVNVEREGDRKKPSPEAETSHGTTVHEGEQKSFDQTEICGAAPAPSTASTGLNPKWIAAGAAAGGGLLICILVCHGGKTPLSSSSP
jgi:ferric-dicitrate binding protein FerR (iron transport regulator)